MSTDRSPINTNTLGARMAGIARRRKLLALGGIGALLGLARGTQLAEASHFGSPAGQENVLHLGTQGLPVNSTTGFGGTVHQLPILLIQQSGQAAASGIRVEANADSSNTAVFGQANFGVGILGTSTSGSGVLGESNATDSDVLDAGVKGINRSTGAAVLGMSQGNGTGNAIGVYGWSTGGVGVRGRSTTAQGLLATSGSAAGVDGQSFSGIGVDGLSSSSTGVRGRSGSTGTGTGVHGQSGGGRGVLGQSTSRAGVEGNSGSNFGIVGTSTSAAGLSGLSVGGEGVLALTQASDKFGLVVLTPLDTTPGAFIKGTIVSTGTAISALRTSQGLTSLYGVQAAEALLEDVGRARLTNGRAHVALDRVFAQTIQTEEYEVFPVPRGECRGLFIASTDGRGFEVRELGGGTSNVEFGYRVVGKRKEMKDGHRLATVEVPDPSKLKLPVPTVPERPGADLSPGVEPKVPTPRRTPGR